VKKNGGLVWRWKEKRRRRINEWKKKKEEVDWVEWSFLFFINVNLHVGIHMETPHH
jgi:hypothetical protein